MALTDLLRRITFQRPETSSPPALEEKVAPQPAVQASLDNRGLLAWDSPKEAERPRRALSKEIEAVRRRLNLPITASLTTLIRAVQGLDPLPGDLGYDPYKTRGYRGRVHEAEERLFGTKLSSAVRYTPLHTFDMLLKASLDNLEELQEQPAVERHSFQTWQVPAKRANSYGLSILFGGVSWEAAHNLMQEYSERLPREGHSKQAALAVLRDLALVYIPGRYIHEVTDEEFEFTWLSRKTHQDSRKLAQLSLLTGRPLEFGYRSTRPKAWHLLDGIISEAPETTREHIRRVNVLSVADDGVAFTARHARGVRTFKFSEVTTSNIPALQPAAVGPEPFAKVAYSRDDKKFHFAFGYLADGGGVAASSEPDFTRYFAEQGTAND